ncbi:MAG TPA: hypothetical protein ENI11_06630 [Actinobacteria bacterium]|nr:hypothetical protein [Actinomycetota bacterium]
MLIEVIVIGILVGLLTGGNLRRLGDIRLRGVELLFAAFIMQALVSSVSAWRPGLGHSLLLISFLLLLAGLSRNKPTPATALMGTGVFLNLIVIFTNGGMPVKIKAWPAGFNDHIHVQLSKTTSLPWLGDVITWPLPGFLGGLVSIGDILLSAGIFVLIVRGMKYQGLRRSKRPAANGQYDKIRSNRDMLS